MGSGWRQSSFVVGVWPADKVEVRGGGKQFSDHFVPGARFLHQQNAFERGNHRVVPGVPRSQDFTRGGALIATQACACL